MPQRVQRALVGMQVLLEEECFRTWWSTCRSSTASCGAPIAALVAVFTDRHKAQGGLTLAFNASKDSCPSLTEKRIELCKKFDYEAIERRKAA